MKNLIQTTILVLLLGNNCFAEDGNINPLPAAQTISLERAANQVIQDEHNRLLGAETEQIDDKSVHVIKVLTEQGHIRHYKFDAVTGQLLGN
ncbi:MAG: hypothetical protein PHH59_05880 [Methylovulum sp.]|uniref:PepSY domain-containing protein n=1 Tax=Methylovulum sp. TaxID=1916980 RepID=UPI00262CB18B|nr:hypothetical protein [Methylovulum sp.]MDD2723540.1 hypothetical protein [Methylovulum sp.]MDD5126125.1 hypothetical protein [Methylovulum sp.]